MNKDHRQLSSSLQCGVGAGEEVVRTDKHTKNHKHGIKKNVERSSKEVLAKCPEKA